MAPEAREARAADFRRIFEAELGYVWGSLRRLGVGERDVEDIAHEVFLDVYRKLDTFDARRPIRPWLFGFAFRAASDYRRLARHRVEVMGEAADEPAQEPLADEALSRSEDAALVTEALSSIDLERRAVLVAYELDGQSMKDIADALSIPLHTAYSRARVAREELAVSVRRIQLRRGDA